MQRDRRALARGVGMRESNMTENGEPTNASLRKAEQLLGNRGSAQDKAPGVAELSAAIRGVGYALLAIREELAAYRADVQQQIGPARR